MVSVFLGPKSKKRDIGLDIKVRAAREAVLRLMDTADVFVHNIRRQKLARLGFGPDALMARQPRLIYAAIHGWRQDGPYGGRPAYDDIIQGFVAVAGLMETLTVKPRYVPTLSAYGTSGLLRAPSVLA